MTNYHVLKKSGAFEIRNYPDLYLLKVLIPGPFELALKNGQRILGEYFSGNNFKQRPLDLKAPLMMVVKPEGWEVSSIIPYDKYPKPVDQNIHFEELLSRSVAVHSFKGAWEYAKFVSKMSVLEDWTKEEQVAVSKPSRMLIYQSFGHMPFFQKSEVHLDVC